MLVGLEAYFRSIGWLLSTIATIFVRQPYAFGKATLLMGVLRIMQVLVMVLPIKVILLAGSSGVPRYMPFIDPDQKFGWIVGLAAGTIVAYILSQFLDALAGRICESAGTQLMQESADLNIIPRQRDQARSIFSDLASFVADILFWGVGIVILSLIDQVTLAVYLGLILGSFVLGTLFAVAGEHGFLAAPHRTITSNTSAYLSVNRTIIFLICFLFILYPFVVGIDANILIALVSFILMRRTIGALVDGVRGAIKLVSKRHLVDTLMFRNRRLLPRLNRRHQTLALLFTPPKRLALVEDMLAVGAPDKTVTSVEWRDPVIRGVSLFAVSCSDGSHYQLQVYARNKAHGLENEEVLFSIVTRQAVGAPGVLAEVDYGDFKCRLLEGGEGRELATEAWRDAHEANIIRLVGVQPTSELKDVYRSSHLHAHQKLTKEFVERVDVALRDENDRNVLASFTANLGDLRARLDKMPFAIGNSDFNRASTMADGENLPLFMYWGRWSLEPLGGGVMSSLNVNELETVLDAVRERRADIAKTLTTDDLRVAGQVQDLVAQIERGSYAAAIEIIVEIESHRAEHLLTAAE